MLPPGQAGGVEKGTGEVCAWPTPAPPLYKTSRSKCSFFLGLIKFFKNGVLCASLCSRQLLCPEENGGSLPETEEKNAVRRRVLFPFHRREGWGWEEFRGLFRAASWAGLAPVSLAPRPAACRWGEHPLGWRCASPWLLALLWGSQPLKGGRV